MAKKSTRLEELHNTFQENGISLETVMQNDRLIREIKKHADEVPDYRHPSYVQHPLGDIIMIVFFAVLGNADEWAEIEAFAKVKEKWFRKYLDLPNGVPTDDTYRVVFSNICTDHFFQVTTGILLRTIDGIIGLAGKRDNIYEKSVVSIDGKVSCGSGRKETAEGKVRALQPRNC